MLNNLSPDVQATIARLDEIEAREKAATRGPWSMSLGFIDWGFPHVQCVHQSDMHHQMPGAILAQLEGGTVECIRRSENVALNQRADNNGNFIIHSRTDVPDLAKALREVTRKLEITNRAVLLHFEWYGLPIDDLNCDYWQGLVTQAEDELARSDAGGNITDERS